MKARIAIILAAALLAGGTLLAKDPVTRTIVVKDGKVIKDGQVFELDGGLFGGPRAYLGVSLLDLTPELREHFGAPKDTGVLVSGVGEDTPAAKAGIRVGDIILAIEGEDVTSSWTVRNGLREKKSGDSARLEVLRGRQRQTLVATIAERELPRIAGSLQLDDLSRTLSQTFSGPEWRARVERFGDCDELQGRIKDLETRLKELEKKLQK